MDGIPPPEPLDVEDVVWALQTADALFRNGEREDALVWLRRAAQAAGVAGADARAVSLAKQAADLTDRLAAGAFADESPTRPASAKMAAVLSTLGGQDKDSDLDPWAEPATPALSDSLEPDEVVTSAPPLQSLQSESRIAIRTPVPAASHPRLAASPRARVELEGVTELADLRDEGRETFAQAGRVTALGVGDAAPSFALALVVSGEVDVMVAGHAAPALRLRNGAVLRSRGTLGVSHELRLVAAGPDVAVATWEEPAVLAALRPCPWVEDALRVAGDRVQAAAGASLGPLGRHLEAAHRFELVARMQLRTYLPGETVLARGAPVASLVVVGTGELELHDGNTPASVLRRVPAGEPLFLGSLVGGATAPRAVRAGDQGAVALCLDARAARELVTVWPPLLDLANAAQD